MPATRHVRTVLPADAEGELAEAYAAAGQKPDDYAHIIVSQSLHPRAMVDHMALYRTLMFRRSPLSRVERELTAVVVSAANDCFY